MARPKKCRRIESAPSAFFFKPRGIPLVDLQEVSLNLDEVEAIRLADDAGLYHEDAAARMQISRSTFGRILGAAHRKVAECLVNGKALRIEIDHSTKMTSHESVFSVKDNRAENERRPARQHPGDDSNGR